MNPLSLRRRQCLPLPFGAPRDSHEVPVLKHVVLPDAGSPCVGDTSPGFPLLEAEWVAWSLSCHIPEPCQTGFALLQLLDELLASCLVGNQTLPRRLDKRLRLAQMHIDWSFLY